MSVATIAIVGVGTAASVGGTMYAASQQKKAAQNAANQMGQMETQSVMLDDPQQIDPLAVLQQLYSTNRQLAGDARQQARASNRFNTNQAIKAYNRMLPGFSQLQAQIGANANAFARGELPSDVQSSITRAAAQRGIQGGFGFGSQGASGGAMGNLNLRNLGLTSLDLAKYGTQTGMQAASNAASMTPRIMGMQDFLYNPQQMLGIEQFNVGAQNQFMLANNGLANQSIANQNQLLHNQIQQQYAADLMQAQMIAQASQQVGGTISGMGAQAYGRKVAPANQTASTPATNVKPTV